MLTELQITNARLFFKGWSDEEVLERAEQHDKLIKKYEHQNKLNMDDARALDTSRRISASANFVLEERLK